MNIKSIFPKKKSESNSEVNDETYVSPLSSGVEIMEEESSRDTAVAIARTTFGGIKFIIGVIVLIFFILATLYTIMSGTIMFTAPSHDKNPTSRLWVSRGTFDGGQITSGTVVYGSATQDAGQNFLSRAMEGYVGAPNSFTAKVLVGPVGDLSSKNGFIYVDNKKTDFKGSIQNHRLRNEYLAQCISGDSCTKGDFVVIKYPSVAGEVRGLLTVSGVKDVEKN